MTVSSQTRQRSSWRRVAFGYILPIIGLLAVAFCAYAWATNFMDALADYRSPVHESLPAGQVLTPLTDGLVFVIVDGLRDDASMQMPYLNELAQRGAELTVIGEAPSYSQNAWTVLVTGASPQISGASPLNVDDIHRIEPIAAGDLFTSASRAGLSTAVYGHYWWEQMIPEEYRDYSAFTPGEDDAADRSILEPALAQLESEPADFTLIHLDQVDYAGHQSGGRSEGYDEAVQRADGYLRQIVERLQGQTLVVVSDHGHINRGGHGGQDQVVLTTRLVAVGKGIRPGQHTQIEQKDVAPTLAALMGVSLPERNQGEPADDLLDWGEAEQAQAWYALATQRLALAPAHLQGIGSPIPGPDANEQLAAIKDLIAQEEWKPAMKQAGDLIADLDAQVDDAYRERITRERWERVWMPAAYFILLGIIIWRNRRRGDNFPIGPALASIATYHILFLVSGNRYSLSTVTGLDPFLLGIAWRALAGLVVGWIWLLILSRPAKSRGERVERTLSYGWLAIAIHAIVILPVVWWIGPTISWMLPDFLLQFILFTTLLQVLLVGAGTLMLAGVGALAPPRKER